MLKDAHLGFFAWLANIARKDLDDKKAENTRVCSNHFISGKPADIMGTTNPDWAPTVNLGHSNVGDVSMAVNRNARAKSRQKKRKEIVEQGRVDMANTYQEIEITSHDFEDPTSSIINTPEEFELNKSAQTEHTPTRDQACQTDIGMSQLEEEKIYLQSVLEELSNLRKHLVSVKLTEETFKENSEKTKFYTGLPNYNTLNCVYKYIHPHTKRNSQNALDAFSEFILVLLRLKLNLPLQELAYRFYISLATASRIFDGWIHVMSIRLQFLIHWPEREELQATMPVVF
ncbi:uncharacterized protein LOC5503578 isoform X2 [Nematostella vectensis]|uniref:uncharacterized protein LOC5503578 isoform X2 n=1 Tax=Nematostella vectensis TaxID=45351 RepID=UPI0020778264|nr:uncharacterized protein LOC5503578 isoform X2 [Nematostella vectensis]